ncbi:hypothetical protein H6F46_17845 [Limnothrix sp. FACHB-1083]|uniref:hypothetical protein n=1 Tax=unclassified Limnothrix TaxID=2632864 RepID=UPI0016801EDE|nr:MULTISPECIES: hypothetical protein [unclassified Limnothrix]MBD2162555.1 hypothetical protein [Limnothrix sp. FACHB-1083]MBD2193611.1 hypothetical protein [Limnothrix sp. FACHB-1088]
MAMSSDSPKSVGTEPTKGSWRRAIARLLRGLIRLLDWAATELETESALPPATSVRSPRLTPAQAGHQVLGWARPWLPESLRKLSDRNLTIALSIMGSVVLVAAIAIFPPKFQPATVAQQPPESQPAPLKPLIPTLLELPSDAEEAEPIAPSGNGAAGSESTPRTTDIPGQTAAESGDVGVSETTPVSSPPPKLERSPEQQLIAAIQDETSEIATRYGDQALVDSIQADFRASRLIVTVPADLWYGLGDRNQDRFAADLLKRSRRLDFNKLELQDREGQLLARSPVVGDRVVIFQRSAEGESTSGA